MKKRNNYKRIVIPYALSLSFLFLNLSPYLSLAQTDSLRRADSLTTKEFKQVLNQQFAGIVTGNPGTSIGNFASVDLKDAAVSFGGTAIFSRSVLQVSGSGSVTDGLFPIFTNSELNTKVSLDLHYHLLCSANDTISFYASSLDERRKAEDAIAEQYFMDTLSIVHAMQLHKYQKTEAVLTGKVAALQTAANAAAPGLLKDSLTFEQQLTQHQLTNIGDSISHYSAERARVMARNKRIDALAAVKSDIQFFSSRFGWFSFGYKVAKNNFKTFDNTLPFGEQIRKMQYVSHQASVQYSYYYWTRQKNVSWFLSLQAAFAYTDNFNDLTKTDISEKKEYGAAPGERSVTKTYSAYTGAYTKDLVSVRFSGDYYHFFLKDNTFAVHLFPAWTVKKSEFPVADAGAGLFLALKNSKDDKAIVNMEFYYQFNDIFKVTDTDLKLFQRNNIGIRFAFPLSFKTK